MALVVGTIESLGKKNVFINIIDKDLQEERNFCNSLT